MVQIALRPPTVTPTPAAVPEAAAARLPPTAAKGAPTFRPAQIQAARESFEKLIKGTAEPAGAERVVNWVQSPTGKAAFSIVLRVARWSSIIGLASISGGSADRTQTQRPHLEALAKQGNLGPFFEQLAFRERPMFDLSGINKALVGVFGDRMVPADEKRAQAFENIGATVFHLLEAGQPQQARQLLQQVVVQLQADGLLDSRAPAREWAEQLLSRHTRAQSAPEVKAKAPGAPGAPDVATPAAKLRPQPIDSALRQARGPSVGAWPAATPQATDTPLTLEAGGQPYAFTVHNDGRQHYSLRYALHGARHEVALPGSTLQQATRVAVQRFAGGVLPGLPTRRADALPDHVSIDSPQGPLRADAVDALPKNSRTVARFWANEATGQVSRQPMQGAGWAEVELHQAPQAGGKDVPPSHGPHEGDDLADIASKLALRMYFGKEDAQLFAPERDSNGNGNGNGRGGDDGGGKGSAPSPSGGGKGPDDRLLKWVLGLTGTGLAMQGWSALSQHHMTVKMADGQNKSNELLQKTYQLSADMMKADAMPISIAPMPAGSLNDVEPTYAARAGAVIDCWDHYVGQAAQNIEANRSVFGADPTHRQLLAGQFLAKAQPVREELARLADTIEGSSVEATQREAFVAMTAVGFVAGADSVPVLGVGGTPVEQRGINRIAQQIEQGAGSHFGGLANFETPLAKPQGEKAAQAAINQAAVDQAFGQQGDIPWPAAAEPAAGDRAKLVSVRDEIANVRRDALNRLFGERVPAAYDSLRSFPQSSEELKKAGSNEGQVRSLFAENGAIDGTFYDQLHEGRSLVAELAARYPRSSEFTSLSSELDALTNALNTLGLNTGNLIR